MKRPGAILPLLLAIPFFAIPVTLDGTTSLPDPPGSKVIGEKQDMSRRCTAPPEIVCGCGTNSTGAPVAGSTLEVVYPHDGAVVAESMILPYNDGEKDENPFRRPEGPTRHGVIFELALSAAAEGLHPKLALPAPNRASRLARGCLHVFLDGQAWGQPTPVKGGLPSDELTAAAAAYHDAQFGSTPSKVLFAKLAGMSSAESRCAIMQDGDGSGPLSVRERRAGTVWRDASRGPEDMAWLSLYLAGVSPGEHVVEFRVFPGGALHFDNTGHDQDSTSFLAAKARFTLAGDEYVRGLPDGTARVVRGEPWGDTRKQEGIGLGYGYRGGIGGFNAGQISMCVLTGYPRGARTSLANSLQSWCEQGLMWAVDELIVLIQHAEDQDEAWLRRLIAEYQRQATNISVGIKPVVRILRADANIGIGRGMSELVKAAQGEYVLFLEDDWVLLRPEVVWRPLMKASLQLLGTGKNWGGADSVRLKSDEFTPQLNLVDTPQVFDHTTGYAHYALDCSTFGAPRAPHFFCACLEDEMHPEGDAWGGRPEDLFHDLEACWEEDAKDNECAMLEGGDHTPLKMYCMPARSCKYTNTPTIFKRAWFLQFIFPTASVDPGITVDKHYLEFTLNISWPYVPHVVAVPSSGLFAHVEMDDKN